MNTTLTALNVDGEYGSISELAHVRVKGKCTYNAYVSAVVSRHTIVVVIVT